MSSCQFTLDQTFLIARLLILLIKQDTLRYYGRKCGLEVLAQLFLGFNLVQLYQTVLPE